MSPSTVPSRPGQVIVLNAASSSGKSTVGRELQRILPRPYLFTGIDSFLPMLRPDGHVGMTWTARTNDDAGAPTAPLRWVFPAHGGDPVHIEFGESGHRLIRGMHRALAAVAFAGNDVIVEHSSCTRSGSETWSRRSEGCLSVWWGFIALLECSKSESGEEATRWSDRREHITRQSILTLITTSGSTLPRRNLVLPPRSLPKSLPPKSTRT